LGDVEASRGREALARAARGDGSAFAEIVRAHQAMVFSVAYHFLRDRSLAEELAQDVFLQLYQNLAHIQSPAHLTFWLRKVACHRSIDQARRQGSERRLGLDEAPELEAVAQPSDPMLARKLQRLIASLPAKARMVVVLRYQEDLEYHEIAETLGMPINTVKSTLQRALAILRAKLTRAVGGVHA
jgi:RNA polymerase sigma-70 factor (ECF subfamily)